MDTQEEFMKYNTSYNFAIGSIALHLGLILFSVVLPQPETAPLKKYVEIDYISSEKKSDESKINEPLQNQIVQQDQNSINEELPLDSELLSQKNQKVQKETISIHRGNFQNIHQTLPKAALEKALPQLLKVYDASDALFQVKKEDSMHHEALNVADTDETLENSINNSVSQTDDHIKDIDQGLETLLNTKEYKFYSYFSRIRQQLSQHWQPKVREKMVKIFHNGRGPASLGQERVTKLLITLNEKGVLVKVQVIGDSGIQDLDDAAIEAFKAAAPFPNPPKGVVENDGTVQIRWDFVLET